MILQLYSYFFLCYLLNVFNAFWLSGVLGKNALFCTEKKSVGFILYGPKNVLSIHPIVTDIFQPHIHSCVCSVSLSGGGDVMVSDRCLTLLLRSQQKPAQ